MSSSRTQQERKIRRTILVLCAVALAFYIGFILMGVSRA